MDAAVALPVEISDWKPAPFALGGETVFAIGDVHGCAGELRVLLDAIARLAGEASGKRRLIYLGDMINRGPDSVGVLEQWAASEEAHGVDHVDRLMGNHEIMMLLTVIGGPHAPQGRDDVALQAHGRTSCCSTRCAPAPASRDARPDQALLKAALGDGVVHRLWGMRSHVRLGNTLFVHGGLDPHADPDEFLTRPVDHLHRGALGLDQPRLPRLEGGLQAAPWWCMATRRPTSTAPSAAWKIRTCSRAIGWASTAAAPAPASSPPPRSSDGRYRILKAGTAFANPISSGEE